MDNKKIIPIVVVAIVLIAGVWYLLGSKEQASAPSNQQSENSKTQPEASKMPPFLIGKVTKVEGQTVTVKSGVDTYTILTTSATSVISQVKDKTGYKNVDSKFSDIKVSAQIVIYYTQSSGSKYTADRIQILNF